MGSVGSSGVMTVGSAGSCGVDCDDVMPVGIVQVPVESTAMK